MGNFDRDSRPSNRGGSRGSFGGGRSSFGGDRGGSRGGFQSRGRSSFGGGRSFGNDRGGDRQMFKATCDNCGKECEVPFRPTSGKPVYCSDCFEKMGGRNGDRDERSERVRPEFRAASNNFDQSKQIDALNLKLDKIISLLEPKAKKEVFVAPIVEETKGADVEVKVPKVKKTKKIVAAEVAEEASE